MIQLSHRSRATVCKDDPDNHTCGVTCLRAVSGWTAPVHPRIVVVVGIPDVVVDTMSSPASPASGPSSAPPVPASIVVVVVLPLVIVLVIVIVFMAMVRAAG